MEPIIVYTDSNRRDVGAVRSFELDLAFGADEQSFECRMRGVELTGGELLYIDGTEYGGIVDRYTQATGSDVTTYAGRTWHGMLAGKIIKPEGGQDYYTLSGDANACIRAVLAKVGLTDVLTGRSSSAGFSINYRFDRFCNAYDGLLKMCASAGAVLMIERHGGITELWAEQVDTITDEADSDLMDFTVTRANRVVNHLVCAGEGQLQERVVVDLYADASGNVSQSQTLTGVDEVAAYYNYSGADESELLSDGIKKLKEYQTNGGADIGEVGTGDWHVGNRLQVRDNRTGVAVTAVVAKKIVKVERGVLTVDYEIDDHVAAQAASFSAELSGIAEQPVPVAVSKETANALINELSEGTSATIYDDDTRIITQNTNTAQTNYLRRPIVKLWDYIKTKADAVYATAAALAGKADADSVPLLKGSTSIAANSDLNDFADTGTYHATSANAATIANTPYAGAFKLYVERTLSTATYLKQRFEIFDGANQWVRVSTNGGSSWGAWFREAPHSSQSATANRFLATPNGSAGLPDYRSIANADLPTVNAAHGGTGQTTLSDAQEALANSLSTESVALTDSEQFIIREVGSTTKWHRRSLSALWNFIKGKASDIFPLLVGGTALASTDNLDDIKDVGTYYITGGSSTPQNAPTGFSVGKVIVDIPHGLSSSSIRGQHYISYSTGREAYRKFESSSWSDWTYEAPRGPRTPQTYDVKSLITQTSTQSGNFTIDSATLCVSGYAAQFEVTFKISAALTAGTEYGIGTLNSSIRPVMRAVAGIGDRRAFADISGGVMYMRPEVAMSASASTSYYFDCSYILANSYTG